MNWHPENSNPGSRPSVSLPGIIVDAYGQLNPALSACCPQIRHLRTDGQTDAASVKVRAKRLALSTAIPHPQTDGQEIFQLLCINILIIKYLYLPLYKQKRL